MAAESPASAPRLQSSEKRLAAGKLAVRVLDFASDEKVDYGSPFVPTGARKSLLEFAAKVVPLGAQQSDGCLNGIPILESRQFDDELYRSVCWICLTRCRSSMLLMLKVGGAALASGCLP